MCFHSIYVCFMLHVLFHYAFFLINQYSFLLHIYSILYPHFLMPHLSIPIHYPIFTTLISNIHIERSDYILILFSLCIFIIHYSIDPLFFYNNSCTIACHFLPLFIIQLTMCPQLLSHVFSLPLINQSTSTNYIPTPEHLDLLPSYPFLIFEWSGVAVIFFFYVTAFNTTFRAPYPSPVRSYSGDWKFGKSR